MVPLNIDKRIVRVPLVGVSHKAKERLKGGRVVLRRRPRAREIRMVVGILKLFPRLLLQNRLLRTELPHRGESPAVRGVVVLTKDLIKHIMWLLHKLRSLRRPRNCSSLCVLRP